MFIVDRDDAYVRAATGAMLTGKPFETLVDACRRQTAEEAAAKVISFADRRARLQKSLAATESLMSMATLKDS